MESRILSLDEAQPLMSKFQEEVFKQVFPHSSFLNGYHFGSIVGNFSYDNLFKETDYEVSLNQSFIHFTTLQSLTSILNNGYFRFSEFNNLEDKSELQYASNVFCENPALAVPSDRIENKKECCFSFSACLISEETLKDSFMWVNYANKGKGVCIQFKINYEETCNFLVGKMQYGQKELEPIKKLKELSTTFQQNNNGFSYNDFPIRIIELLAFHKYEIFRKENEVRFFFREEKYSHQVHDHNAIYKDVNSNNDVRYFFRNFLKERKKVLENEALEIIQDSERTKVAVKNYFEGFPTFEIEKITLGNCLSDDQKYHIVELLNFIKTKFNYSFEILHLNNENEIRTYI